jgi:hypothetical protein
MRGFSPQDAAAGEPDAFRKGLVTFGLGQVGATLAGLKRKARDFTAGNSGCDEMTAVGEHGLQHLVEHVV